MVPKNIVFFFLMERDMDMTNIQTGDFLPSRFLGMTWTQALCYGPDASAPDLEKVCWCGYRFPYILPARVSD